MKSEESIRSQISLLREYYKQETTKLCQASDAADLLNTWMYRQQLEIQILVLEETLRKD